MDLHVIIGADDYLVTEAAKRLIADGAGLEVVDSANSTNAESQLADIRAADASFSTPPFLEPSKVTWWKHVNFLPGAEGKKKLAEEVKEALECFAAKLAAAPLPENQEFVISAPGLLKTSIFAKTLAGVAEVVQFGGEKPWEAARNAAVRMIDLAKESGLRFESGAAEAFVSRVGVDTRSLVGELAKMRDYLGPGEEVITLAAIDEVTSQGVGTEPEVWAVTDAIGARDLEKALQAVARFEGDSGFAVLMTSVVEKFFRQMLDVVDGRVEGLNPYALNKMRGFLNKWTRNELRVARWRFFDLREKAVSGVASIDTLIVNAIVRSCAKRK